MFSDQFPIFMRFRLALVSCLLLAAPVLARSAPRTNEIIVSAVNYAQTPPAVLKKLFRDPAELTDPPPPAPVARPVQHYQFLPGEALESDLTYLQVCKLLVPALAQKRLVNTFDQAKVDFVLRVSFGGRTWRDPIVRAGDLEWKHGLVPRRRGRSASLDATAAWDERAGGDEASLYQTEQFLNELNPSGGAEGMADRLIRGLHTEEYFLVVVDAFAVASLQAKGNSAPRVWTTFIAVPRQGKTKFSDIAAAMIAKASPYFGETLPGKAHFTDRTGTVTSGELKVVEEDVHPKAK